MAIPKFQSCFLILRRSSAEFISRGAFSTRIEGFVASSRLAISLIRASSGLVSIGFLAGSSACALLAGRLPALRDVMAKDPVLPEEFQRHMITQFMGQALSTWARVEEELSLVFIHAIGAAFDEPARAVFFSVRSFEARLGMTHAAIDAMHPPLPSPVPPATDSLSKE